MLHKQRYKNIQQHIYNTDLNTLIKYNNTESPGQYNKAGKRNSIQIRKE